VSVGERTRKRECCQRMRQNKIGNQRLRKHVSGSWGEKWRLGRWRERRDLGSV
jgi:hypothetical protein